MFTIETEETIKKKFFVLVSKFFSKIKHFSIGSANFLPTAQERKCKKYMFWPLFVKRYQHVIYNFWLKSGNFLSTFFANKDRKVRFSGHTEHTCKFEMSLLENLGLQITWFLYTGNKKTPIYQNGNSCFGIKLFDSFFSEKTSISMQSPTHQNMRLRTTHNLHKHRRSPNWINNYGTVTVTTIFDTLYEIENLGNWVIFGYCEQFLAQLQYHVS